MINIDKYGFKYILSLGLVITVLYIFAAPLYSDDYVHVTNITIKNDGKHLLVSYKVRGAFNESINQRIESGLTTEFTFRVRLFMQRPPFGEKRVAEKKIVNRVTYDNITSKYSVKIIINEEETEYTYTNFNDMQQKMSNIVDLPIIHINEMEKNKEYYLKIKGELIEKNYLWFPLNFLISFFSKDFDTGWKISDSFLINKIEQLKAPVKKKIKGS
jgi:hypothetical protein